MAYEKNTWVPGETLMSADNFNHIEEGLSNAAATADAARDQADLCLPMSGGVVTGALTVQKELNAESFTVWGHSSAVGYSVSKDDGVTSYQDVPASKPTTVLSQTMQPGTWMVTVGCSLAISTSGRYAVSFVAPEQSTFALAYGVSCDYYASTMYYHPSKTFVISVDTATKYFFQIYGESAFKYRGANITVARIA